MRPLDKWECFAVGVESHVSVPIGRCDVMVYFLIELVCLACGSDVHWKNFGSSSFIEKFQPGTWDLDRYSGWDCGSFLGNLIATSEIWIGLDFLFLLFCLVCLEIWGTLQKLLGYIAVGLRVQICMFACSQGKY